MSKKFMLSAAGLSAAAIGGSASAAVVSFHYDLWPSEASWTIADSEGTIVAQGSISAASGTAFVASSPTGSGIFYYNGSNYTDGYIKFYSLDLAAGDYTVTLNDTWGDGWNAAQYGYGSDDWSDAFAYGSYELAISGASATGTFTVVPAPGALALLGLAGLAGTRRRRA